MSKIDHLFVDKECCRKSINQIVTMERVERNKKYVWVTCKICKGVQLLDEPLDSDVIHEQKEA